LVAKGHCRGDTRAVYGYGRVGVWSRVGAIGLDGLRDPRVKRVAIPSPEHAPYGAAAKQALERMGLWADVAPRLVYAENARQSLQLAESGNVEAAFVPLPLASDGGPERAGAHFTLVDGALHAPLAQTIVRCGADDADADRFVALVTSDAGQALLRRYGFYVPTPAAAEAAAEPSPARATP
jgi:molybdate transport system substrate-binding protein